MVIEKLEDEIQKVRGSIQNIKQARSLDSLKLELEAVLKEKKELEDAQINKRKNKEEKTGLRNEKLGVRSAGVRKILPNSSQKSYLI